MRMAAVQEEGAMTQSTCRSFLRIARAWSFSFGITDLTAFVSRSIPSVIIFHKCNSSQSMITVGPLALPCDGQSP
jgi:hypothetical protein